MQRQITIIPALYRYSPVYYKNKSYKPQTFASGLDSLGDLLHGGVDAMGRTTQGHATVGVLGRGSCHGEVLGKVKSEYL